MSCETETLYLTINNHPLQSPVVLASMAGVTDANYALARKAHIGIAFLGGFNIDETAAAASKEIESTGRKEFSYGLEEIAAETALLKDTKILTGLNLRGKDPRAFLTAAETIGKDVIYEIDAHCRQKPMTKAGCGEALLGNTDTLCAIVQTLSDAGFTVSVKFRAGITDDIKLAKLLWKSGAHILHIDLMDFGHAKIRQIRNACPLILIANNGVTNPDVMMDYFSHGADLVSVARKSDTDTLTALDFFIKETAKSVGWYNAPKQLCRGGDLRSLAFCCMPIKSCALLPFLEKTGLAREEYLELKKVLTADTPLSQGNQTCFGSLAWCCKSSTPCMFRDMTMQAVGLEKTTYMKLKQQLAEQILAYVFRNHE